jgi:hypothetical protein
MILVMVELMDGGIPRTCAPFKAFGGGRVEPFHPNFVKPLGTGFTRSNVADEAPRMPS